MMLATCSDTFSRPVAGGAAGAGAGMGALVIDCCCVTAAARSVGAGTVRGTDAPWIGCAATAAEVSAVFVPCPTCDAPELFSGRLTLSRADDCDIGALVLDRAGAAGDEVVAADAEVGAE